MVRSSPAQISYAIQVLLMFSKAALSSKILTPQFVKTTKEKCLILLEKLSMNTIDAEIAAKELRKITEGLNQALAAQHEPIPYPTFTFAPIENQVRGNILAFELFLNYKLKSGELTLEQEEPLFSKALVLWNSVGSQMKSKDAMSALSRLIHKVNSFLQTQDKYPVPDDTEY